MKCRFERVHYDLVFTLTIVAMKCRFERVHYDLVFTLTIVAKEYGFESALGPCIYINISKEV